MVVDLIFLNTEVSLTQALEDVGRARTPFAIIITQQHQVHRSCTVNILFGTPQGNSHKQCEAVGKWRALAMCTLFFYFCRAQKHANAGRHDAGCPQL